MIKVTVKYTSSNVNIEGKVDIYNFSNDKECFDFLFNLEKNKIQNIYTKLGLGIYKKAPRYTYYNIDKFGNSKPLTSSQIKNNALHKKVTDAVEYGLSVYITHF